MLRRLASGAALVAAAAMVLVGCTPPEPTETTPAVTASPTATPMDERAVEAAAFAIAREFVALVDRGFTSSALPRDELGSVATPAAIEKVQSELNQFVSLGWQIEGTSVLDSPSLINWDGPDQERGTAQLIACLDTSGVTTTDENGQPTSGNEPRQPRLFSVEYNHDEMLVADVSPVPSQTELPGCGS